MPIYEYKCQNCGYRLEQLQKISDEPLRTCPKCDQKQLIKLISNTSFQLKGTGWYVTDFKDKQTKDSSKSAPEKKATEMLSTAKADEKSSEKFKDTETKTSSQ